METYLLILHLQRAELPCRSQEKLLRVTGLLEREQNNNQYYMPSVSERSIYRNTGCIKETEQI